MSDPFDLPAAHPFGIHNLPYAVFEHDGTSRVGSRLGDHVVDLCSIPGAPYADAWAQPSLDAFLALTLADWRHARAWLQEEIDDEQLVERCCHHFEQLIRAWKTFRAD